MKILYDFHKFCDKIRVWIKLSVWIILIINHHSYIKKFSINFQLPNLSLKFYLEQTSVFQYNPSLTLCFLLFSTLSFYIFFNYGIIIIEFYLPRYAE